MGFDFTCIEVTDFCEEEIRCWLDAKLILVSFILKIYTFALR